MRSQDRAGKWTGRSASRRDPLRNGCRHAHQKRPRTKLVRGLLMSGRRPDGRGGVPFELSERRSDRVVNYGHTTWMAADASGVLTNDTELVIVEPHGAVGLMSTMSRIMNEPV